MSADDATTLELSRTIDEALGGLLAPGSEVAYVNVPNIGNLGDNAIYTGAREALRRRSIRVVYSCEPAAYRRRIMRRALGERGTILIHGGGNLGDLYRKAGQQTVRMRVLRDFPNARVIQLPQTIFFQSERAARRVAERLRSHANLTVMVRDHASVEGARALGLPEPILCPDTAFALGRLSRPAPPARPIVWIAREDVERRDVELPDLGDEVTPRDWPSGPAQRRGETGLAIRAEWALTRALARRIGTFPRLDPALARLASSRLEPLAARRVRLAARILAAGSVVVSDRVHGHILACLMGIPNVLLDNSYGKNRQFYETWTHRYELAHFAPDPESAQAIARRLAGRA